MALFGEGMPDFVDSEFACWIPKQEGVLIPRVSQMPTSDSEEKEKPPTSNSNLLQDELIADFGKALEEEEGANWNSDVKLVSRDGKEFKAHRAILGLRSPVFLAMFSSDIMKESTGGEVKIEDVSSAGIKFMLHYIYTGSLLPFTYGDDDLVPADTPTIQEVLYVAAKYQLKGLLHHFDQNLGESIKCDPDNVNTFLHLAVKYKLDKALKTIHEKIWKNRDLFDKSLSMLEKTLENADI